MNCSRTLNFYALIINILVIVFTIVGLSTVLNTASNAINYLPYFSIWISIFVAFLSICLIPLNIICLVTSNEFTPKWVYLLYFITVPSEAIIFLTSVIYLIPFNHVAVDNFTVFIRIVNPLLVICSCVIFMQKQRYIFNDCLFCLIPIIFYIAFYLAYCGYFGLEKGDFYCFLNNNWAFLFFVIPIFVIPIIPLAILFFNTHNFLEKKFHKHDRILYNGVSIPNLGLGTWLIKNDDVTDVVKNGLKIGYRHIDTAQAYENEEGVGKAINESSVPRNELFITSKIKAEIKDYETAKKSIDESLKKLNLDYIDLMLIHCPQPWKEYGSNKTYDDENYEVWKALEEAYKAKKIKAIGVSNFNIRDLKSLMAKASIKPMVNQILVCPGNTPTKLINFCFKNQIVVEGYSPINHGKALEDVRLKDLSNKYRIPIPNLCIKYVLENHMVALPKASSYKHLKDNFNCDIYISPSDKYLMSYMYELDFGEDGCTWNASGENDYYEID